MQRVGGRSPNRDGFQQNLKCSLGEKIDFTRDRRKVDLPDPLRPVTTIKSPGFIDSDTTLSEISGYPEIKTSYDAMCVLRSQFSFRMFFSSASKENKRSNEMRKIDRF